MGFGGGESKTKVSSKPYPRTEEGQELLTALMGLMGFEKLPSAWTEDPYVQAYIEATGDTSVISPLRALTEWRARTGAVENLLEQRAQDYGALIPAAMRAATEAMNLPPIMLNWGGLRLPIYPFRTRASAIGQLSSLIGSQLGMAKGIQDIGESYMSKFYDPLINIAYGLESARLRVPGTRVTTTSSGGSFLGNMLGLVGNVLTLGALGNVFDRAKGLFGGGGGSGVLSRSPMYYYTPQTGWTWET